MRRLAIVAIVSLALGGTAGYFLGRRSPETKRQEPVRSRVESSVEVRQTASHPEAEKEAEYVGQPDGLERLVEEFREKAGTEEGAPLAAALGQVHDPQVEKLAVDLVRSGDLAHQLAGLDLLDRLDIENPETRTLVLETLRTDPRPEILSAALYALHRGVPDPRETRETLAVLAPLASHSVPEVRRRGVIALAEWGAVEPALTALRDPSPDVRAGAAFALRNAPGAADTLAARVADESEDWAVREQAWRSLARCPLDERTYAIYARFREKHEAAGEAGDNR